MLRDGSGQHDAAFEHGVVSGDASEHGEKCDRLHRKLKRIVKARAGLDLEEAAALRDAQQLMLWRRYGYASLLEYMELEMGYSPRAAIERLRVAHAIVELPKLAEAMEQGDLTFSGARELTRVATPETEEQWLGATKDMNLRELEDAVSGHKRGQLPDDPADESLRKRIIRLEVSQEAFALWCQIQQVVHKEKGERVDDTAIVEAVGGVYLRTKAQTARDVAAYQIAVTVCTACKKGWQDGGNVTVPMSPPAVERALCDAVHIGSIDDDDGASESTCSSASPGAQGRSPSAHASPGKSANASPGKSASPGTSTKSSPRPPTTNTGQASTDGAAVRPSRTIPARVRRKVNRRDHGKCQVPACRSSINVDIHHVIYWANGGTHSVDQMVTLCESHHLAHHDGTLNIRRENGAFVFDRVGRNNFTRVERANDTRLALKNLGFKKHEIKAAVDHTRTHVGTANLALDQWIRIALDYCRRTTMPTPQTD